MAKVPTAKSGDHRGVKIMFERNKMIPDGLSDEAKSHLRQLVANE